ncbi:MAG: segregation/condensation protein A [Anaerolineae bacterium]|nr:segregation/condensation protein A [Anaerolineae bacterium]MDH7473218.1 segregation/condensation protein A [Anaerolineae bacterium]
MSEHVIAHPYQVRLPVFEGPLDLLLHLIEREELDITAVSLAQVTDQYLAYLALMEEPPAEVLADFLVMAARLLLIKSRALLPRPSEVLSSEEEDVGDDLARQLIEYKKFKQAAESLRQREEAGLRSYLRLAPPPRPERPLDLEDVTLDDLVAAVRQALAVTPPAPPVSEVVAPFQITIGDRIAAIRDILRTHAQVSFHHLLSEATSRLEIIVTFLAVLELIKSGYVDVQQDRLFGEIIILGKPGLEINHNGHEEH